MDRRLSIVLAILVATTAGCKKSESNGNPPPESTPTASVPQPTETPTSMGGGGPLTGTPPTTKHTVYLDTSTSTGSSTSPAIVTCVSESGKDTMEWIAPAGTTISFPGSNLGVYTPTCTSNQCSSGPYTVNSVNCPTGSCVGVNLPAYTVKVGSITIYGRIIINK